MAVPSIFVAAELLGLGYSAASFRLWATSAATWAHCAASVAYHLDNAFRGSLDHERLSSPFRTADFCFMHLCTFTYGWALAPRTLLFNLVALLINSSCVLALLWRLHLGQPGSKSDAHRVVGCIVYFTSAMLHRGDMTNYARIMLSYFVGGIFFVASPKLGGWGHGIFHLMLVPATYSVLRSMADA